MSPSPCSGLLLVEYRRSVVNHKRTDLGAPRCGLVRTSAGAAPGVPLGSPAPDADEPLRSKALPCPRTGVRGQRQLATSATPFTARCYLLATGWLRHIAPAKNKSADYE
jgi:hypothetical protein